MMAIGMLPYPLAARAAEQADPPAKLNAPVPVPAAQGAAATAASQAPPGAVQPGPAPAQAPPPPAPAGTRAAPPPAATQAAPVKTFAVLEYQVEGNTVLPNIEIERAVTPFLGENKSIKDVEAARTELERAYHDHGYRTVLVNIPPQKVADGVVRLVVTEARVGKLKVAGSRYHSLKGIREKVPQLNPDAVPNFGEVQKELGEVNRSADVRVQPILRASETPGRVDVELAVQDKLPLHAMLETDNRYSANTAHVRVNAEVRYDNLFQSNQSASFQYQIAPSDTRNAKIWSASYVIPMSSQLTVALYAVHSDSNVAAVGNIDVVGKGDIYGLRLITPLPAHARDFYHSFTAGVDYKDFGQNVTLQGATDSVQSPVHYEPFTLQYSATWLGAAPAQGGHPAATGSGRSDTNLALGLNFLIRGVGSDWRQFANRRAGADGSYITFHPTLIREQVLPGRWSLIGTVDGQFASGPLINNEQFAIGGADTVRGYVEAERLGDYGYRGALELRTPQLLAPHFAHVEESYAFLFTDAGHVRIIDPLPHQDASFTLESAGLGFKFKAAGLLVGADVAHIFKSGAATPAGRLRALFSVSYAY